MARDFLDRYVDEEEKTRRLRVAEEGAAPVGGGKFTHLTLPSTANYLTSPGPGIRTVSLPWVETLWHPTSPANNLPITLENSNISGIGGVSGKFIVLSEAGIYRIGFKGFVSTPTNAETDITAGISLFPSLGNPGDGEKAEFDAPNWRTTAGNTSLYFSLSMERTVPAGWRINPHLEFQGAAEWRVWTPLFDAGFAARLTISKL